MPDLADQAYHVERQHFLASLAGARPRPAGRQRIEPSGVVCLDCGEPIPAGRLAAVPDATHCVECQAALEVSPW